jgi:hypothetical protein
MCQRHVHQPPVQAPCAHNSLGMASIDIFCHDSVLEPQLLVFLSLLLTISALQIDVCRLLLPRDTP